MSGVVVVAKHIDTMAKRSGNTTASLNSAKKAKNDEFYTQLSDIERELEHYEKHFKDKVILCNCDDPRVSNFFRHFYCNFCRLGIKKLISVCYKNLNPDLFSQNKDEQAVYCVYDGQKRENDICTDNDYNKFLRQNRWQTLKGDGDFRSQECIELLQQADIVVTNPPFSLFREYVGQLIEHKKKFVIIGHQNAITYKEIFKLVKDNKIWLGFGFRRTCAHFINVHYEDTASDRDHREGMIRVSGVVWFTNLDTTKRHEKLILYKKYTPKEYPKYDHYDAIEVSKVGEIPIDYDGIMGVPVTFLDKFNPDQFEIIGSADDKDFYPIIFGKYVGRITVQGKQPFKRLFIRKKR